MVGRTNGLVFIGLIVLTLAVAMVLSGWSAQPWVCVDLRKVCNLARPASAVAGFSCFCELCLPLVSHMAKRAVRPCESPYSGVLAAASLWLISLSNFMS